MAAPPPAPPAIRLTCPGQVEVRERTLDPWQRLAGWPSPGLLVRCATTASDVTSEVLWLRPGMRPVPAAAIGAGPWSPTQVAWRGQQRGARMVGTWQRIAPNGQVRATVALGARGDGVFDDVSDDGTLRAIGPLRDGLREGTWRFVVRGALRAEAVYRAGALHGEARDLRADGSTELVTAWREGVRDGLHTSYWPSGAKRWEGRFAQGLRDGDWCAWSTDGALWGCNRLQRGDGAWAEWRDDDGSVAQWGTLRADRWHGAWRRLHPHGALAEEAMYEDGKRLASGSAHYDADGNPVQPVAAVLGVLSLGGPLAGPVRSLPSGGGGLGGLRPSGAASQGATIALQVVDAQGQAVALRPETEQLVVHLLRRCVQHASHPGPDAASWQAGVRADGRLHQLRQSAGRQGYLGCMAQPLHLLQLQPPLPPQPVSIFVTVRIP